MTERIPRRHDLVWLDPASIGGLSISPQHRDAAADWLRRERPLVAGRREPGEPLLQLGFTLPGVGSRRRVGIRAPLAAMVDHGPPPPLADLIAAAPACWQAPLTTLVEALDAAGLSARGYGSLVNQWLCGEACLRPDSDVDVLLDCTGRADVERALAILARHGDGTPRIDGELRVAGRAVAWRELAGASGAGRLVLAKSDTAVRLMRAPAFIDARSEAGVEHARHPGPRPVAA